LANFLSLWQQPANLTTSNCKTIILFYKCLQIVDKPVYNLGFGDFDEKKSEKEEPKD
jgi:hypothetical protein